MYRSHFGLTHAPLGKECPQLWHHEQFDDIEKQFKWLLQSPGVGLLTAEPGLGKTAAMRQITRSLNPHQYWVHYIAETDFGRLEFYRQLALAFGLPPSYRRAQLWHDIKECIVNLATTKNILPILIIDEAQNLQPDFLRDSPSFLNFVFDSKDYLTVWFLGHPEFARTLNRTHHAALSSRIQARCTIKPIEDRETFKQFLLHGFTQAGCTQTLLSESGIDLIRMASNGNPRQTHRLIVRSLQIATDRKINHLPDDIVKEAIEILKQA